MSLNRVTILGRLTADPEKKTTTTGTSVVSFTVAVDRFTKGQADFIECTAWRSTADFISQYFKKGQLIGCDGRLSTRSYQDKNGNNRKVTEVVVENVSFCGKAEKDPAPTEKEFKVVENDEDLPF